METLMLAKKMEKGDKKIGSNDNEEDEDYDDDDHGSDVETKGNEDVVDGMRTDPLVFIDDIMDDIVDDQERQGDNDDERMESGKKPYLDKAYAWVIDFAAFGIHVLLAGYCRSGGVIFVEMQNQFGSNSSMTSMIVGIQEAVSSITSLIFLGYVLKKTSPRFMCLVGTACLVLGVAGSSLAGSTDFLIFTQGVFVGLAIGTAYCGSVVVISHYFMKRRALATSIVMAGASVGGTVMPLLSRFLFDSFGFSGGFLLLGGILAHCFIFSILLIPVQHFERRYMQSLTSPHSSIFDGNQTMWDNVDVHLAGKGGEAKEKEKEYYEVSLDHVSLDPQILQKDKSLTKHQNKQINVVTTLSPSTDNCHSHLLAVDDPPRQICFSERDHFSKCNATSSVLAATQVSSVDLSSTSSQSSVDLSSTPYQISHTKKRNIRQLSSSDGSTTLLDKPPVMSSQAHLPFHLQNFFHSASTLHSIADLSNISVYASTRNFESKGYERKSNCIQAWKGVSQSVYHHPLLRSATFWFLAVFFAFSWVGYIIPFTYIPALAKERGLTEDDGALFLSIINILDLQGRLIPGIIVNTGYVTASKVIILPMTAAGIVSYFTPFMHSYKSLLGLVITYGLFGGSYAAMQTLVVIEMVGLKHYPFVLAFCYFMMSVGTTISYPLSGLMKDKTGTYSTSYHYLATVQLLAVIILVCLPVIKRLDVRRGLLA